MPVFTEYFHRGNTAVSETGDGRAAERMKCPGQEFDTENETDAFETAREAPTHDTDNFRPLRLEHQVYRRVRQRL